MACNDGNASFLRIVRRYEKSSSNELKRKIEIMKEAILWLNQMVILLPETFCQKNTDQNMDNAILEGQQWIDRTNNSMLTTCVNEIVGIQDVTDDMFYNMYYHRLKKDIKSFVYSDGFRRMYQDRDLFAIQYSGEQDGVENSYLTVFYKEGTINYNMTLGCLEKDWKKNKKTFVRILDSIEWI